MPPRREDLYYDIVRTMYATVYGVYPRITKRWAPAAAAHITLLPVMLNNPDELPEIISNVKLPESSVLLPDTSVRDAIQRGYAPEPNDAVALLRRANWVYAGKLPLKAANAE